MRYIIILTLFVSIVAEKPVLGQSKLKEWKQSLSANSSDLQLITDSQKVVLLIKIANQYVNQNPDSAVLYANKVLELLDESEQLPQQLEAQKILAEAYYVLSNSKKSYESSIKVIAVADSLNDQVSMLYGQVHLGLAFLLQNRFREAIDIFEVYRNLAARLQDSSSLSRAYLDLSISYDAVQSHDTAQVYVDSCIWVSRSSNDNYYLAMGLNRKGYILSNQKQYDSAIVNHQKSLEIIADNNNWERCFAYAGLAKAYAGMEDYANSIAYGQRSIELGKQMNAKWEIKNAAEIISAAYASAGDFEKAYDYHKLYKAYHDSIFTEENERRINDLQLRQAQTERDALKQENQLQNKILNQKNIQLILMIVAAVILVALLVVLYFSFKSRRKYIEQLASQRDKLNELNKSKDRILSILAHDMRSPMNSILQLLHLMKHEKDSDIDFERLMDEVHHRTTTVSNTLNSLLEWSISQFRNSAGEPEVVRVVDIVDEQVNLCRYDASQKKIQLLHDQANGTEVKVQVEHLRIILRNLISNAIKYSFENSSINLSYKLQDTHLIIEVRDQGIGMSPQVMAGLFDSKTNSARGTKNEIGTGLGLFICKEYAEMNAGSLTVDSKEGEGTVFYLKLPVAQ